jgi:hypothetical protein
MAGAPADVDVAVADADAVVSVTVSVFVAVDSEDPPHAVAVNPTATAADVNKYAVRFIFAPLVAHRSNRRAAFSLFLLF